MRIDLEGWLTREPDSQIRGVAVLSVRCFNRHAKRFNFDDIQLMSDELYIGGVFDRQRVYHIIDLESKEKDFTMFVIDQKELLKFYNP